MSSQVNGAPLFTIEQIELIRRLRNSGITKEQIVQAFESLERLDRELGPVYSVPVTLTVRTNHIINFLTSTTRKSLACAILFSKKMTDLLSV